MVASNLRAKVEIYVSCMRNAFNHNYRNSSVIVDLAMGQIYHVPQNVFLVWIL